jgi:UDP-glucose 4-epimerase
MGTTVRGGQRLLPPQKVVVTGGAGYIGSHLVDWLAGEGHQITVLDDLSTGYAGRLAARTRSGEVRLVTGSILDAALVDRELTGAGTVFHLAAAVGVGRIVADPLGSLRTNLIGTENVLSACARHGCRVVLASSSEVYGRPHDVPMSEHGERVLGPTTVPRWSYAAAKAVDEHLAFAYAGHGLRVSVVRYFNCYGPRLDRQGHASVVAVFVRHALAGTPIPLHANGRQTRCFTYISDTVRGTLLAAAVPQAEGQVFNIGSATETSILELAETIVAATGSRSPIQQTPYENVYGARFEDVPRRVPDVRQARQVLGWEPQVSLEEGLKQTIAWWGRARSVGAGRAERRGSE